MAETSRRCPCWVPAAVTLTPVPLKNVIGAVRQSMVGREPSSVASESFGRKDQDTASPIPGQRIRPYLAEFFLSRQRISAAPAEEREPVGRDGDQVQRR